MKLTAIELKNESKFTKDYKAFDSKMGRFFTYNPYLETTYAKRLTYLDGQTYQREALTEALLKMNQDWGITQASIDEIDRLTDPNSVVTIGGQQAGLLGGPLYSVNKVITIIKEARKLENDLKRPVIPVFWIAGEDHDYEEINHVNLNVDGRYKKIKTNQQNSMNESISDLSLTEQTKKEWFNSVIETLPETMHSKEVINALSEIVEKSRTFIEFFARTIYYLFPREGIVLVDSGSAHLREIEVPYFLKIIDQTKELSETVVSRLEELKEIYAVSLEAEINDLHLFYRMNTGERVLLEKNEAGLIEDKNKQVQFTLSELLEIAKQEPERLSNNVVTRPLMQEMLFPTLAFIGGYGEINYWAALKGAFESLQLEMPPVLPRYSITYISPKTMKDSQKYNLDLAYLIEYGASQVKQNFLKSQENAPIEEMILALQKDFTQMHEPIRELAKELGSDLEALADVNLMKVKRELSFLETKLKQSIEKKHAIDLEKFNHLSNELNPNRGLQERVHNILPWINKFGSEMFSEVLLLNLLDVRKHYLVIL